MKESVVIGLVLYFAGCILFFIGGAFVIAGATGQPWLGYAIGLLVLSLLIGIAELVGY